MKSKEQWYEIVRLKAIYADRMISQPIHEWAQNLIAVRMKYREELNALNVLFIYHTHERRE